MADLYPCRVLRVVAPNVQGPDVEETTPTPNTVCRPCDRPLDDGGIFRHQDFLPSEDAVVGQTLVSRQHILIGRQLVEEPNVEPLLLCLGERANLS